MWLGSDATLTQCAAIDHNENVACVFPYSYAMSYLSHLTGLPDDDFFLIALSDFIGFLGFLIVRSDRYRRKIIAYAGDNQNVAQRIKHRRPKNRISQYLRLILNRFEVEHDFTVLPCYTNSPHNEMFDQLSRPGASEAVEHATASGLELIGVVAASQWFLAERLRLRSQILPTDPSDRVENITQFFEKRITREIPKSIKPGARVSFFGRGAAAWAEPANLLQAEWILTLKYDWFSESAALGLPLEGMELAEGGPLAIWVFAYPPDPIDVASLERALSAHPPQVAVFDIHPKWAPSPGLLIALESTHTAWHWDVNSALLGPPN